MLQCNKFTLEKPPEDSSLISSVLWAEGKRTNAQIPGYQLLRQFELSYGYLLITDYDCPYEEGVGIHLLSKDFTLRSSRIIGAAYATAWFKEIEWHDERNFQILLQHNDNYWCFHIRKWGIPYIRPLISMWQVNAAEPIKHS